VPGAQLAAGLLVAISVDLQFFNSAPKERYVTAASPAFVDLATETLSTSADLADRSACQFPALAC
jgi:hypothetical protein